MIYSNERYAQSYERTTSNNYKNDYKLPSGYTKDTINGYLSERYIEFMKIITKICNGFPKVQKFFDEACPSIYKNGNKKLFQQGLFKLHIREKSKIKGAFNKIWNSYCNNTINNANDLQNTIEDVFNKHKKFFGIAK